MDKPKFDQKRYKPVQDIRSNQFVQEYADKLRRERKGLLGGEVLVAKERGRPGRLIPTDKIVAMPLTPSQIGMGVTLAGGVLKLDFSQVQVFTGFKHTPEERRKIASKSRTELPEFKVYKTKVLKA